jgi:predicted secreted protein
LQRKSLKAFWISIKVSFQVNRWLLADGGMVMKRTGVIFLVVLLSVIPVASLNSQAVKAETSTGGWTKTYGGTSGDYAQALVQTSDGGYALAGMTESFGAGPSDCWLVKTDASGNMQWNKTYGGTGSDYATAMEQTADGGYALAGITDSFGTGHSDFWLVKTDASGNAQWNKTYGGTGGDEAYALVQTNDDGYALAGRTGSFGGGGNDFWLVKTDASGTMEWNRTYGGTSYDLAYDLVQTSDGGYALAGETTSFGAGNNDAWLVRTDASGNMMWNRTYGGTNEDGATALVETSDGGYALAGRTTSYGAGTADFWLVKTDASGNAQWNKTYGGTSSDEATALVETSDGGYALAGYTNSFSAGNNDFWLVKTDAAGNMMWNRTYEGTNWDYAQALVQTSDGGYALAGRTTSYGAGDPDFWLVKTKADGTVQDWSPDLVLIALVAAVIVVVILLAVFLMRRKSQRSPPNSIRFSNTSRHALK